MNSPTAPTTAPTLVTPVTATAAFPGMDPESIFQHCRFNPADDGRIARSAVITDWLNSSAVVPDLSGLGVPKAAVDMWGEGVRFGWNFADGAGDDERTLEVSIDFMYANRFDRYEATMVYMASDGETILDTPDGREALKRKSLTSWYHQEEFSMDRLMQFITVTLQAVATGALPGEAPEGLVLGVNPQRAFLGLCTEAVEAFRVAR